MIVNYKGKDVKLPDFLIVGAAKSGTTSLHYYLKHHPDVFMPKVKETWFLTLMDNQNVKSPIGLENSVVREVEDYIKCFSKAKDGQMIGEACPGYLYTYNNAIRNIKSLYGEKYKNIKIIIILRNPSERAWSHFMMHRENHVEHISDMSEALKPEIITQRVKNKFTFDYIGFGMYYMQVKAFIEEFPETKIFLYDEFSKDSLKVTKEIFIFLGVDSGFVPDIEVRHNISGKTRFDSLNRFIHGKYPMKRFFKSLIPDQTRIWIREAVDRRNIQKQEMPIELRTKLAGLYRDDILKLQGLIKRDLSMWLEV